MLTIETKYFIHIKNYRESFDGFEYVPILLPNMSKNINQHPDWKHGWHSRRHQTDEAAVLARQRRQEKKYAKLQRAYEQSPPSFKSGIRKKGEELGFW